MSEEKEQYWREHITGWRVSGISQVEYCRKHGISKSTFWIWKRKLSVAKSKTEAPVIVPVSLERISEMPLSKPIRKRWVVDMDLEKFFDRVNHDVLMARVRRKVKDWRVLRLIRRYLRAGMMYGGVASQRVMGTPQGGPLSPLLSNILLDDLDKELERRGHAFCRYADDCNIYVRTRRSGERAMASVSRFLAERLKLRVNEAKSAVGRPWERTFLGYSMTSHRKPRLKVAPSSVKRLRNALRAEFRKGRGRSLRTVINTLTPKLQGWINYFKLAEVKNVFEELDEWLRHKLRNIIWRQWKRPFTRAKNLMKLGLTEKRAWISATNQRGPWWNSKASHMNQAFRKKFFDSMGFVSLLTEHRRHQSVM